MVAAAILSGMIAPSPAAWQCIRRGIAGVGSASVTGLEAIEPTRLQLAGTSAAAFKSFGAFEAAQLPAAAATAFENQPT
jgi:hypothetical protein